MPDNGTLTAANREVTLSTAALRRLARMHARAEGAQLAANAATQALQQLQAMLRDALTEACEEQGVAIPDGNTAPVDIDWRTGVVKVGDAETQPPPPIPMGEPMAQPLPPPSF
jgi:hypothetical protein